MQVVTSAKLLGSSVYKNSTAWLKYRRCLKFPVFQKKTSSVMFGVFCGFFVGFVFFLMNVV